MQYHLNGYRAGPPDLKPQFDSPDGAPETVDVLIVGCGPAGLTLAAQLSAFPTIRTRIVDKKPGPLRVGQADGVACRSMEMFEAFGFAHRVRREAYWVNEMAFWKPAPDGSASLVRTGRVQDVEDDLSEQPHTILNQARVHDFYLEHMANSPGRLTPQYNRTLTSLVRDDHADYPVVAQFDVTDAGITTTETVRARYVVGCDGARSTVRQSMGLSLHGESARQLWGVMDILATTDFPDIRLKCLIQSASQGSVLIIPREGGYMVRLYIELDTLAGSERASDRKVTPEQLIHKAQSIFSPFQLEVKDVVWWSAYEIGQRVCDRFDDAGSDGDRTPPRVFIAGDACHTHSPKAGQGMNVSMADAFNLGWKLAAVLQGRATPELLYTYHAERHAKAQELIEFDREMAQRVSASPDKAVFQHYFSKHARYTAGVETRYDPSLIVGDGAHQSLACGLLVGMRFHSAPVIRLADAKPMQLGHALEADGRWRVIVFAAEDDTGQTGGAVSQLAHDLETHPDSPVLQYTPAGADIDSVIDVRAVFQGDHRSLAIDAMPPLLRPQKGRFGLVDYEKIFCEDSQLGSVYDRRGVNKARGAVVLVRPDHTVANVLPLASTCALSAFFAQFMVSAPDRREADKGYAQ